jgi:hypothetical protein
VEARRKCENVKSDEGKLTGRVETKIKVVVN